MRASFALLSAVVSVVGFGCGSSVTLFGGDSDSGAGGSGGAAPSTVAVGGSGPSATTDVATSATGTSATGASATGTSATGAAAGGAGGDPNTTGSNTAPATGTGPTVAATGTGGAPAVLPCGDQQCTQGGDSACCWDNYKAYGAVQAECVMGSIANDGCTTAQDGQGYETRIECKSEVHCGSGEVCCARRKTGTYNGQQFGYYDQATCETTCNAAENRFVLCEPNVTVCPMLPQMGGSVQGVCKQSALLPAGYTVCGYPG